MKDKHNRRVATFGQEWLLGWGILVLWMNFASCWKLWLFSLFSSGEAKPCLSNRLSPLTHKAMNNKRRHLHFSSKLNARVSVISFPALQLLLFHRKRVSRAKSVNYPKGFMSKEVSKSSVPLTEPEVGSNYLAYCIREVEELLSQKEDFASYLDSKDSKPFARPCTGVENINFCDSKEVVDTNVTETLFCNGIGDGLSSIQKERLKVSSKQSLSVVSQEVDEILNSVLTMSKLKRQLKQKEKTPSNLNSGDSDGSQSLTKKQKLSTSPSLSRASTHAGPLGTQSSEEASESKNTVRKDSTAVSTEEIPSSFQRICVECNATSTPQWRHNHDQAGHQILCNACWLRSKKKRVSSLGDLQKPAEKKLKPELEAEAEAEAETDADESLRIFLDIGGLHTKAAEETMKKHSDELFAKLEHMEHQLEKHLDVITSKCRKMTKVEKKELCKLIQNLPPKNLDRVVDIIVQHRKLLKEHHCNEIRVDLENEDNVALWRIYYYVEAVASASKCLK